VLMMIVRPQGLVIARRRRYPAPAGEGA